MKLTFDIKGIAELERRAREAFGTLADDVVGALYEEAEVEMTEAKQRTPVDTGALRSSGHVVPPAAGDREVVLAFGGPAAPYALIVHEDLDAHHPVGQAKYLESTLLESAPHLAGRVARRLGLKE